jgi:hypothetical protein
MMQGDTGKFVAGIVDQVQGGLGALLTVEQLLSGVPPEKLRQLRADAAQAGKLLPLLGKHGFVLAAELTSVDPPQGQVTLILPDAGPRAGPVFGALNLATSFSKLDVKQKKVDGRDVSYAPLDVVNLAWWAEGKHAVVRLGTGKIDDLVRGLNGKGPRLTEAPLYKRVAGFKGFRTAARGFVDTAAFARHANKVGKEAAQFVDDLGLNGLESLVFYSGFEGKAERGLIEMDTKGPRKGALALLKGKPFRLDEAPALPPDVVSWSVTNVDPVGFYDVVLKTIENVGRIANVPNALDVKGLNKQVNDFLGTDLRKDLLGSLAGRLAMYNAPSDGPLTLGQTLLFKVKDEEKLLEAVEAAVRGISRVADSDVRIRKRTYRGVTVREVTVREKGFFFRPSYAVCNGWLVVSAFPQPVHAFIARTKGDLTSWKPSPTVRATFAELPREMVSVSYSDPRPGLKQLLSLAPLVGGLIDSLNQDINFDVGSLPTAQEVTRHLFPNVSVGTDDGRVLRLESRSSLPLPFEMTGVDTYGLFILLSLGRIF